MDYIITNKGLELQAKVNAGKKLIFTKGEAGSGITESPELLSSLTNKKQNLQIDSIESLGTKTELSCVLTNLELQQEYLLTQLGIYAKCEGETEVLFIVGQQVQGEPIPAISKQEVEYIFSIVIKIDNTKDISIDVGVNDFLRKPYFYDHVNQHNNPHAVTKSHVGLGNVDNTRDLDKPVSTHVRDAISESYISSNGYADQKIAALVNGAPEALDTLLELANAINNNKALADALQDAIGKKANQTELDTHTGNKTVHITASERNTWNAKQNTITVDGALSLTSTNPIQNKVVKAAIDQQTAITTEITSNLGGNRLITEGSGANAKYYIQTGADAASKKLLGEPFLIATGNGSQNYDIRSKVPNYNKLSITDFLINVTSMSLDSASTGTWTQPWSASTNMSISYNPTTGILTINGRLSVNSNTSYIWATANLGYEIYLK